MAKRLDEKVEAPKHYDRLAEKAWGKIEEASMLATMQDDASDVESRFVLLGVDRSSLIQLVGIERYHAEFAELDADQRYVAMLIELGL